jgi:hypothetical protein
MARPRIHQSDCERSPKHFYNNKAGQADTGQKNDGTNTSTHQKQKPDHLQSPSPAELWLSAACLTSNSSDHQCGTGESLRRFAKHDLPCACGFVSASP